jgi:diguanylate cyclase (GGDEF)-like protein
MGPKLPSEENPDPHAHPLYKVLKRLAADLHTLFELASKEDEQSWHNYLALAKKEIEALQSHPDWKKDELLLYKSLIPEVYDHLNLLISAMQSSQERYKKLATSDLLTGVYNRNYFNVTIVRDIERAKRRDERLSFIMIDVNGFKQINDTYGHLHGDGVLRACADIFKKSVRKSDFLCRYGGDEFLIVTPQPTCESNKQLFDRIRQNTDEWNALHSVSDYRLSFSIGCAVWEKGRDILQVLQQADQEMYRNKTKMAKRQA